MFKTCVVHMMFFPVSFVVVGRKSFITKACDFLVENSTFVNVFMLHFDMTGFVDELNIVLTN